MDCCATTDITLVKGKTFSRVLRWETHPIVYKAITGVANSAPVEITAVGHGLVDGWRAAVVSVQGMREINAKVSEKGRPPSAGEFHKATVVDVDTITFNDINSLDFAAYQSGGALLYYTPVDLTGFVARFQVRTSLEDTGTPLISLTSPTDIVIDNTAKTITFTISATITEAIDWTDAVYELEMESSGGVVTQLLKGSVLVQGEAVK